MHESHDRWDAVNFAWLEIFREVAARGSLTAAGAALGYTQSAVSRHISALEAETGAQLFDRLPRGVRLTDEGRCLLAHAEAMLERRTAAQQELEALRNLGGGRLRVGAFDSADALLVPRALAAFRAAHPRVALSLVEGNTPFLVDQLRDGAIDTAMVSAYPHHALDTEWLELRHVLDDPLMVALPAGHKLARRRSLRLAELCDERWIEGFPHTADMLVEACLHAGFRPQFDFSVRSWIAKQGFIAAGLGLTLVPLLAAGGLRPDIVAVPLRPDDAPIRKVFAATWRGITTPPAVTSFLEHLDTTAAALRGR
jgi:DNA-binding transcriptional LysR family regulator